ncbi:MAG: hypothetical protein GY930_02960 [bacterium]|nr:hypothetical protein [bacterium]
MAPPLHIDGLPLSQENEQAAMDPTIAARFENASALWFTGGDQSRITALFEPELRPEFDPPPWRERRLIELATHRMLKDGGVIADSSAGAAMMAAFIEVVGPSGLCVLDLGDLGGIIPLHGSRPYGANAVPDAWEFELSLLGTGDRWDPIAGKAIPHAGRILRQGPAKSPAPDSPSLNPWDPDVLEKTLLRLSLDPGTPQVMLGERHRVQLSVTSSSSLLTNS